MKYLFFMLMCFSIQAYSQHTIQFKIVDQATQEPLIGATAKMQDGSGKVADINGIIVFNNIAEGSHTF